MNGAINGANVLTRSQGGPPFTLLEALYAVANAHSTMTQARPGVGGIQGYEVAGLVKAANAIGEQIAARAGSLAGGDDIPF